MARYVRRHESCTLTFHPWEALPDGRYWGLLQSWVGGRLFAAITDSIAAERLVAEWTREDG